jgi:oligoribonuclease NrnB/cAMP/cGMP phosphodiesterase (DHH superfamily)
MILPHTQNPSNLTPNRLSDPSLIYDIVVFHYPCQDGIASGWIVNHYHELFNKHIELFPCQYGTKIPLDKFTNKKVIFCDYCPPLEELEQIEKVVSHIKILDHHKTAKDALANKSYATFSMEKSGAGLTWNHFFPTKPTPEFILMIEDRDLWSWSINGSRDLTSGLFTYCDAIGLYNFQEIFNLFNELYQEHGSLLNESSSTINRTSKMKMCMEFGSIISKANLLKAQYLADSHAKKIDQYESYNICIVNCPSDLTSDVGNILAQKETIDFAVLWKYSHPHEEYYVSLRSTNIDISPIAKKFGGGGHPHAAGFSTHINPVTLFTQYAPL